MIMWKTIFFYTCYVYRKCVCNIFEIKNPQPRAYLLHAAYLLSKFLPSYAWQKHATFEELHTVEAKYVIRRNTFDAICASPDYERPDIELTKRLIAEKAEQGKSVLYIDIGANIGCYCIRVANAFRGWDKLSVIAFEPFPESFDLLKKNISVNDFAENIDAVCAALSEAPGTAPLYISNQDPGSNSLHVHNHTTSAPVLVNLKRLDDIELVWKKRRTADCVFLKLDCEGAEVSVLKGGEAFLSSIPDVLIMVEDFVDSGVCHYLTRNQWECFAKQTPYNSFWRKRGPMPHRYRSP
jgi:FkbM family methyltransferase